MKALACLAALIELSATQSNIAPAIHPEIVRVDCLTGRGTAFRVGPNILLSVAHVTSQKSCFIEGKPFTVVQAKGDFSILSVEQPSDRWLRIDCRGFVKGREYVSIGYGRGLDTQTEVDVTATGEVIFGLARLWAVFNAIPGMSGGPVTDAETGRVVGTINAYNAALGNSGSLELKGTPVCNSETA